MDDTTHSELGSPTSITHQEDALQTYLLAGMMEGLSQLSFLSPDNSSCVKLTEN